MTDLELLEGFMRQQGVPYEVITDKAILIHHLSGKAAPDVVGVRVFPNAANPRIIVDIYEAVDYLRSKGLVRC